MKTLIIFSPQQGIFNKFSPSYCKDFLQTDKEIAKVSEKYERIIFLIGEHTDSVGSIPNYHQGFTIFDSLPNLSLINKINTNNKTIVYKKHIAVSDPEEKHFWKLIENSTEIGVCGFLPSWEMIPFVIELIFNKKFEYPIKIHQNAIEDVTHEFKTNAINYFNILGLDIV